MTIDWWRVGVWTVLLLNAVLIAELGYIWYADRHPPRDCRPVFVVMSEETFL